MKRDPRVNANKANLKTYIVLYFAINLLCSIHSFALYLQGRQSGSFVAYGIVSELLLISTLAACLLYVFDMFHRRHYAKPLTLISTTAREIAGGNFSVRIPPQRCDGKKDEFDVIYDDLNAMAEELSSVEMLKRDFVSNVSHELKSPLAIIQTYAATLQEADLSETERMEYTGKIADASNRLAVLVSNILQMSRLDNQKIKSKSKPFNLSEQLCRCALAFEALWEEKNIQMDIDMDQTITLNSDEELLDIVWNNLLANAIKFTAMNGYISITAKQENARIIVTIRDNGCGIAPDAVKHIFDKFYQEDTSHATQGNGLGLALVKQIVILLDGMITVESTPGEGAAFSVILDENTINQNEE